MGLRSYKACFLFNLILFFCGWRYGFLAAPSTVAGLCGNSLVGHLQGRMRNQ